MLALTIIGMVACFFVGFLFGKLLSGMKQGTSPQVESVSDLSIRIAEMKTKFDEFEKNREKLDEEREKRFRDFMDNIHRTFETLNEKTLKVDEEKGERIKELVSQMKTFFEEQKRNTERFLSEQGKSREEIEKRRDAQIEDMKRMISTFTKTVSGTKTRGMTGESILKEALKESIRVGLIKCDLKTDNGEVEFAWDLGDGKYIPIDSKMPDVFQLLEEYESTSEPKEAEKYKKAIIDKVKKEINRVKKYQNSSNTIDSCILVVPEGILDIAPELVGMGKHENVFVCSYKDVFPVAHTLQDQYVRTKEEGDIGRYRQMVKNLFRILENIGSKADSIERALTTIRNANEKIRTEVGKGKREMEYLPEEKTSKIGE